MTMTEDQLEQEALSIAIGHPPDPQHAKEIGIFRHVIANMRRKPPFLGMSRSGASNLALNAVLPPQPVQSLQPQGAA